MKIKHYLEQLYGTSDSQQNSNLNEKIRLYLSIRITLLLAVSLMTSVTVNSYNLATSISLYGITFGSFVVTYLFSLWFDDLSKIGYFLTSQILYDALFASALIYYTGGIESIYIFLFPITIIYAAVIIGKFASLVTSFLSFFLLVATTSLTIEHFDLPPALYLHGVAYIVTAVLIGALIDEAQKNKEKLKEKEKNATALEKLNQTILENMSTGVIVTDPSGKIIDMNRVIYNWFGLYPQEAIKSMESFTQKLILEDLKNPILPISINSIEKKVLPHIVSTFDANGNSIKLFFIQDMTEALLLQEENSRNARLASVGRMAAGIAHEIRNPLAGISGSAQVLSSSQSNLDPSDKKLLTNIINESDRMNRLIKDFLTLSKKSPTQKKSIALHEIIGDVIENIESRSDFPKNLRIIWNEKNPCFTSGDSDRIKQSIYNLIINAIEAILDNKNPNSEELISIDLKTEKEHALITIKDTGPGISLENKDKVFEPFFTTKPAGTGLGLSTVHNFIKQHNGELKLVHSTNKGSEFLIKLPLYKSKENDTQIA